VESALLSWKGLALLLPAGAFLLLLIVLAAAEAFRPFHRAPCEGRGRLATNFGLALVNMGVVAALPVSGVAAAAWARHEGFGLLYRIDAPLAAAIIGTVAARSLVAYVLHRLAHWLPLLWRFHRVHHCDTAVDLSTGLRHHPVEALYLSVSAAALTALLALDPQALAAYEAVALAVSLFVHANLRLPERTDRILGLLLWTPALHHVHHSARQVETDSNYGDVLTVWDRLFGTFRRLGHGEVAQLRFGLGDADDHGAADFLVQLAGPLRRAAREAGNTG
jgi:sterol desaturase/sphingolipid hydroxylase (fatty acid hydroxylase superfamily)